MGLVAKFSRLFWLLVLLWLSFVVGFGCFVLLLGLVVGRVCLFSGMVAIWLVDVAAVFGS